MARLHDLRFTFTVVWRVSVYIEDERGWTRQQILAIIDR